MPHRVSVSSVLMRKNLSSLRDFPKIIHEAGGRIFMLQGLNGWNPELEDEHIHKHRRFFTFFPRRRLHVVMDEIKSEAARYHIDLLVSHRSQLDAYKWDKAVEEYYRPAARESPVTKACMVPWRSMYVDSRGKVYPCCESAASQPIGDLASESFEQIWNGGALRQFRDNLVQPGTTPAACLNCYAAPFGIHPLALYRAVMVDLRESAPGRWTCRARNIGSEPWGGDTLVRVGTSRPYDRASLLYHSSWLSPTRICSHRETRVGSGEIATFEFEISEPVHGQAEAFQLVVELKEWLPETVFHLPSGGAAGSGRTALQ